jgi:DNA-binding MarR family transcriptional regulator
MERFETFTVLIMKINRSIHKIKAAEMAEFNLKGPHVSCLYYLGRAETMTAKELRDVCGEDKAAVSRSIEYLEKNGYVACASDSKKRYKAALTLTEKGKQAAARIAEKIDAVLERSSEGISAEALQAVYDGLTTIEKNLSEICENY